MASEVDQLEFAELVRRFGLYLDELNAKLADGGGGSGQPNLNSLPIAEAADGGPNNLIVGLTPNGTAKRFTTHLFASRRTQDLVPTARVLATDLLQVYRADGQSYAMQASALTQFTSGKINVKEPPYNCKGDYREVGDVTVTQFSATVKSATNPWVAEDVGKVIYIGRRTQSRATMTRTIAQVVSAGEIVLGPGPGGSISAASYGASSLIAGWGTDDTAGLRAALDAARAPVGRYGYGGVVELPPGQYLTDHLFLPRRAAIFGYGPRQSCFVRKPSASTQPTVSNELKSDDFPVLVNCGIYGNKGLINAQQHGYVYQATAGFGTYEQGDPFPHWHGIHIWDTYGDAIVHAGQGNGICTDVNIDGPAGFGFRSTGYDMDIANLYIIGAAKGGIHCDFGSANNNFNNGKFSYSGGFPTTPNDDQGCLVWLGPESGGNMFNACRAQESSMSGWRIGGKKNQLAACHAEDTGNVSTYQGSSASAPPADKARAGVEIMPNALDCRIDCFVTYSIPVSNQQNRATHAVFFSDRTSDKPALHNRVKIEVLYDMVRDDQYYNGGTAVTGRVTPPTTGRYARGVVGYDSENGIDPSNRLSINDRAIA